MTKGVITWITLFANESLEIRLTITERPDQVSLSARISIYLSPTSIPLSASIPLFFDGGAGILYLRPHTDH